MVVLTGVERNTPTNALPTHRKESRLAVGTITWTIWIASGLISPICRSGSTFSKSQSIRTECRSKISKIMQWFVISLMMVIRYDGGIVAYSDPKPNLAPHCCFTAWCLWREWWTHKKQNIFLYFFARRSIISPAFRLTEFIYLFSVHVKFFIRAWLIVIARIKKNNKKCNRTLWSLCKMMCTFIVSIYNMGGITWLIWLLLKSVLLLSCHLQYRVYCACACHC